MAIPTATSLASDLSVKISSLANGSHLHRLLQDSGKPVFDFDQSLLPHWQATLQTVPAGTQATINISDNASWKTSTGIGFGLAPGAHGKLEIIASGPVFTYAPDLQSPPTSQLPSADYTGSVYLRISLDFKIAGNASGAGVAAGVGISGNIKGSAGASLIFCHRVSSSAVLGNAVIEALESLAFPFEPSAALDMKAGDLAQVNFQGCLDASFSASYGVPGIAFAAPSVAAVVASVTKGAAELTLPSGLIDLGATAAVQYMHADAFTALVHKQDSQNAFLYILRANKSQISAGVGLSAQISITNMPGVTVNPAILTQAIDKITGGLGSAQIASKIPELVGALNAKIACWVRDAGKGAALAAAWDQAKAAASLFKYKVALSSANLVSQSWSDLCKGNLAQAASIGGLTLQPGSGIDHQLSRSFTISLHLFNFFAAKKDTFFQHSYVVVTDTGIRYMYDIGKESDTKIQKAIERCGIHFAATADQSSAGSITNADVDLYLELSASNDAQQAGRIAEAIDFIPSNAQVTLAQKALQQFAAANSAGTVNLVCVLKPSAYGRITSSEYTGNKPPANQQQDMANWNTFRDASKLLLQLDFLAKVNYQTWSNFNLISNTGSANGTPDRRNSGNPGALPPSFWNNITTNGQVATYFALNSARFMNLCDDLHALAVQVSAANTGDRWNEVLDTLQQIVESDVNYDYSKPAIAALLKVSNPQNVTAASTSDQRCFTCSLTLT